MNATTLWTSGDGTTTVVHDAEDRFYEIREDDKSAGLLAYERNADHVTLTHTVVQEEYRGKGLAGILIREALTDLRAEGVTVANRCSAVERFVHARPEFRDVIGESKL
ncbi:MAG: GNAT family N-acetyltransferase [Actinocrinis sp.]